MTDQKVPEGDSITITLDENSQAFYAGVATAAKIEDGLADTTPTPDFETRVRWFWLQIGVEMGRRFTNEQKDLSEPFIEGAKTRAPYDDAVVRVVIARNALAHYGEDVDDDEIRTGLRALLETTAGRIEDGADDGEILNAIDQNVGKFTTNIWG